MEKSIRSVGNSWEARVIPAFAEWSHFQTDRHGEEVYVRIVGTSGRKPEKSARNTIYFNNNENNDIDRIFYVSKAQTSNIIKLVKKIQNIIDENLNQYIIIKFYGRRLESVTFEEKLKNENKKTAFDKTF